MKIFLTVLLLFLSNQVFSQDLALSIQNDKNLDSNLKNVLIKIHTLVIKSQTLKDPNVSESNAKELSKSFECLMYLNLFPIDSIETKSITNHLNLIHSLINRDNYLSSKINSALFTLNENPKSCDFKIDETTPIFKKSNIHKHEIEEDYNSIMSIKNTVHPEFKEIIETSEKMLTKLKFNENSYSYKKQFFSTFANNVKPLLDMAKGVIIVKGPECIKYLKEKFDKNCSKELKYNQLPSTEMQLLFCDKDFKTPEGDKKCPI